MCLIFFARDLDVNEHFKIRLLNDLKARCFKRAKEIKERMGINSHKNVQTPNYNMSSQSGNHFFPGSERRQSHPRLKSKYFELTSEDMQGVENPEFDLAKIFQVKMNVSSGGKASGGGRVQRKKDWGPDWYKNEKKIMLQMGQSSKAIRQARACAYNKSTDLTNKMLAEAYQSSINQIK